MSLPKIIAIVGPTASGKTELGIALAKKFNGEIVSADSRQIYQKMNIATDKPVGEWRRHGRHKAYFVEAVPHYLMDIIDPGKNYTVADFKSAAIRICRDISARGKLPIVVGGTGLYLWSLIDNLDIPAIAPNKNLRRSLESKGLDELARLLRQLDPAGARKIDLKNPRRVIRALEVQIITGASFSSQRKKGAPLFDVLQIGLHWPKEILLKRIEERCDSYIKRGLLEEVSGLTKQKYGWDLPSMSTLGYRQIGYYLRGEMSLEQALATLKKDTKNYAKRQITWFKRDQRIKWIEGSDPKKAEELVEKFLDAKD